MKWKTKDGVSIEVKNMHTEHIKNILKMYESKGYIGQKTFDFYFTCKPPQGDIAQLAFETELMAIIECPVSIWIDIFEKELEKRKEKNENLCV